MVLTWGLPREGGSSDTLQTDVPAGRAPQCAGPGPGSPNTASSSSVRDPKIQLLRCGGGRGRSQLGFVSKEARKAPMTEFLFGTHS